MTERRLTRLSCRFPRSTERLAARWLATLLLIAAAVLGPGSRGAMAVEVSISCGAVGQELAQCREGAKTWADRTGNTVRVVSTPNSASERLALYQQLLAGGSTAIDVYQIDVVWPGILARNLVDLAPYVGDAPSQHFPAIIRNNTVDGHLVALPFYTDAGVLFYRADLLKKYGLPVPQTWREMTETAAHIQKAERDAGNDGLWGYVFQGRAYEGLTVNALEWIDSRGGVLVDAQGHVKVDSPAARDALTEAAQWVGRISPPGVLNYAEEEARGLFQSGHAVFMRNWPYAWALAQGEDSPVRGKVGVAALPSGDPAKGPAKHSGVLGGWNLAVSRHSRHIPEAVDLALFLTSAGEQKRRAVAAAYNPTRPALYQDSQVLAANPFFGTLYPSFESAVARPSRVTGRKYNRVSSAVANEVHGVLSGRSDPEAALYELAHELRRMSRRGW